MSPAGIKEVKQVGRCKMTKRVVVRTCRFQVK